MADPVDVSPKKPIEPVYLGDSVYASFDGYQIWLHLNDHHSRPLIALDPKTWDQLVSYGKRVFGGA